MISEMSSKTLYLPTESFLYLEPEDETYYMFLIKENEYKNLKKKKEFLKIHQIFDNQYLVSAKSKYLQLLKYKTCNADLLQF